MMMESHKNLIVAITKALGVVGDIFDAKTSKEAIERAKLAYELCGEAQRHALTFIVDEEKEDDSCTEGFGTNRGGL